MTPRGEDRSFGDDPIDEDEGETSRPSGYGARELLATAAWFGLTAGFVELLLLVVRVQLQEKGFFLRSRHFVWMVPASDLLLFLAVGSMGAVVVAASARASRPTYRATLRIFLFTALLCQFMLIRGFHLAACVLLAAASLVLALGV